MKLTSSGVLKSQLAGRPCIGCIVQLNTCVSAVKLVNGLFSCTDGIPFVLNGAFFHTGSKTFIEPAMAALIPFVLVNDAVAVVAARVAFALAYGSAKEAFASVAR